MLRLVSLSQFNEREVCKRNHTFLLLSIGRQYQHYHLHRKDTANVNLFCFDDMFMFTRGGVFVGQESGVDWR